jgi:hypothetical protein
MGCCNCGSDYVVSVDNFCSTNCRREYTLRKGCQYCKKPYSPLFNGWLVGGFSGYTDSSLICPECLIKISEYKEYKENIEQSNSLIDEKIANLQALFPKTSPYIDIANGDVYFMGYDVYLTSMEIRELLEEMGSIRVSGKIQEHDDIENKIKQLEQKRIGIIRFEDWKNTNTKGGDET